MSSPDVATVKALLDQLRLPTQPDPNEPQIDPILADAIATIQGLESLQRTLGARRAADGHLRGATWRRGEIRARLVKQPPSIKVTRKLAVFDRILPKNAQAETYIVDRLISRLDGFYHLHYPKVRRKKSPFIRQSMALLGWPEDTLTNGRIRDAIARNAKMTGRLNTLSRSIDTP